MEAPSADRRLLRIPFFHQQIRRVSLFLIDFSSPHRVPSVSHPPSVRPPVFLLCFHPSPTAADVSNPQFVPVKQFPFPC